MIKQQVKASFHKKQLKDLYDENKISIIGSFLVVITTLFFIDNPLLKSNKESLSWIFFLGLITIIRGIDTFLYIKSYKKTTSHSVFFTRFTIGSLLTAISLAGLFWSCFELSIGILEYQILTLLIAIVITSVATVSLSIHLGILFSFQLIILFTLQVKIMTGIENSSFFMQLSLFTPIYFLLQILAAKRINNKYIENINLQIGFKEKEKLYKDLQFAVNQHGIISTTDVKGNIIYINNKLSKISKYSREELIGQNHRLVKSNEHSYSFWKEMYQTLAKGKVWHAEVKNIAKDGSFYWVDTTVVPFLNKDKKPYQYTSIRTDITRLKKLEQQTLNDKNDALIRAKVSQILQGQSSLRQRTVKALQAISKIDNLLDQNKLGVFLLPEGAKSLKIFVTHGQYTEEFLHKEKCVKLGSCLCGRVALSSKLLVSDDCFTDPDHTHSFEDMTRHGHYIVPLSHNNKVLGILFMYTEPHPSRDQARLEILSYIGNLFGLAIANEKVKQELEQAKKNAEAMAQEKSDFLANMSHEIRTPMNGVLGMLDLLNNRNIDKKSKDYIDIAHSSANMLLNVINDILDISKIESGKLHIESIDFDLKKAVEDTTHLLSKLAHQKNLELSCYIPPDINTWLQGDVMRLQQILNNLISNAIKFTAKGEVTVNISTVSLSSNTIKLRFEIKDTGIGIPAQKQKALFHAFTQADTSTSRKYGGTGLGLAICKSLVEMMKGTIGLISEEGKGSIFWFELPFSSVSKTKELSLPLSDLHILTIDDNKTNCLILTKYIESWGGKNIAETIPENGLYRLLEAHKKNQPFDILLLDMQMPGVTGLQVAKKIRSEPIFSNLKIILLSSMGLDQSINKQQLFDLLINKPIRQLGLFDAISTVQNISTKQIKLAKKENDYGQLTGEILFVDDNVINQQVGIAMLAKLGLNAVVVSNGQEALDSLTNKRFDLILMDCQMPIMDGYEATKKIRQLEISTGQKKIIIVALTANAMQHDREKCVDAGMDDYLTKPYSIKNLFDTLSSWITVMDNKNSSTIETVKTTTHQPTLSPQIPLINKVKFEETRELMDDNFEFIINAFIDSGRIHISNLKNALTDNNIQAFKSTIHTLKGSCGILGIHRLYEYCIELEEKYQFEEINPMNTWVEEISIIFDNSVQTIQFLTNEREV